MDSVMNIFQTAIWTVLFIVPGYVAARTKHYWMLTTARQPNDKTIESIIWSFLIYYLLNFIPPSIFNVSAFSQAIVDNLRTPDRVLFDSVFLVSYVKVLFLSVVVGFLWGKFFPCKFFALLLHRTPFTRVWDDFFFYNSKKASNNGIWIEMKDGSQWAGKMRTVTDTPGSAEIWINGIRKYENGKLCRTKYSDMLINSNDIIRLFILDDDVCQTTEKKRFKWFRLFSKRKNKAM